MIQSRIDTTKRNRLLNDKLMHILRVKFFILKHPKIEHKPGKMRDFRTSDFDWPKVIVIIIFFSFSTSCNTEYKNKF